MLCPRTGGRAFRAAASVSFTGISALPHVNTVSTRLVAVFVVHWRRVTGGRAG
jgi:hypothetical protein